MQMKTLAVLFAVVAAAAAHGHKVCTDGSTATCECADGTVVTGGNRRGERSWGSRCADSSKPTCTCADGTAPTRKSPCADGAQPTCAGACADGTDPVFDGDHSTPPCADASKPDWSKCVCADSTVIPTWGGHRGGRGGHGFGGHQA